MQELTKCDKSVLELSAVAVHSPHRWIILIKIALQYFNLHKSQHLILSKSMEFVISKIAVDRIVVCHLKILILKFIIDWQSFIEIFPRLSSVSRYVSDNRFHLNPIILLICSSLYRGKRKRNDKEVRVFFGSCFRGFGTILFVLIFLNPFNSMNTPLEKLEIRARRERTPFQRLHHRGLISCRGSRIIPALFLRPRANAPLPSK